MDDIFQQLGERTESRFLGFRSESGYWKMETEPGNLIRLLEVLYRDNVFWCDYLQSITAEHLSGSPDKIQIHYHLESLTKGWKVQVICSQELPESGALPEFPSLASIWEAAAWHEREAAELLGIHFIGHPDLRKLLLPSDWNGYPLRKNYKPDEQYHGLKIRYSTED
jgi:NADH-quinone oxidoreductase subunit C